MNKSGEARSAQIPLKWMNDLPASLASIQIASLLELQMLPSTLKTLVHGDYMIRTIERIITSTGFSLQHSDNGEITGLFYHCKLSSAYQPVFEAARNNIIGQEARIRADLNGNGEIQLSPWHIFALAPDDEQLIKLDRLCRTIHALNFLDNITNKQMKLFVSVQPRLLESVKDDHGSAFEQILDIIGIRTSRIVIEIPVEANRDWRLLKRVIMNYRAHGYLISVNYSGTNNDRISELGKLYPNVIRIDARDLLRRSVLDPLIVTAHDQGADVLVGNIETSYQLTDAIHAGADLLQGNFLARYSRKADNILTPFSWRIPDERNGYRFDNESLQENQPYRSI